MKTICSNCQAENNPEAAYCLSCGHALPVQEVEKKEAVVFGYQRRKKRSPILIAIFVICFWAAFFGVRTLIKPSVDTELVKVAQDMNRGCPFQVDELTVLVEVKALPNKTIQYNYQLNDLTKAEVNLDTVKKYIFPGLVKNARENPEVKSFRDNEISIKYNYSDKNGDFITEYVVTPDMYK